jgi:hypothetical protein
MWWDAQRCRMPYPLEKQGDVVFCRTAYVVRQRAKFQLRFGGDFGNSGESLEGRP